MLVLDAQRLERITRDDEAFEQAKRLMWAHHDPVELVRAHRAFLADLQKPEHAAGRAPSLHYFQRARALIAQAIKQRVFRRG